MPSNYFSRYFATIGDALSSYHHDDFCEIKKKIIKSYTDGHKLIFIGNGGSAAIASHVSVDFSKTAGIRAVNFNEADLITCYANDFGYENWVVESLKTYCDPDDLVFLISSSGQSRNITNAAKHCKEVGTSVITLSGFKSDNPLKKLGDINLWVNSTSYNIVEMTHHIWLLSILDNLLYDREIHI